MPEIEGYKVVPLRLTSSAEHCHDVYMREHFIRLMDPNKPKGRTLFILNIPPYVTTDSLKRFFEEIGPVEFVEFAEKPGREETTKWQAKIIPFSDESPPFKFKVAYVVFKKTISLERALQVNSIDLFSKGNGEPFIETGMQLWHTQYNKRFPDEEKLQAEIDKYMAEYDARELEAQEAAKTTEADPDGWVTVGKKGKNAGFEQTETVVGRLEDKVQRNKKKELTNFYTFQIRESKMKKIIEMRQKFEEDKSKIEQLKQMRRFKPF